MVFVCVCEKIRNKNRLDFFCVTVLYKIVSWLWMQITEECYKNRKELVILKRWRFILSTSKLSFEPLVRWYPEDNTDVTSPRCLHVCVYVHLHVSCVYVHLILVYFVYVHLHVFSVYVYLHVFCVYVHLHVFCVCLSSCIIYVCSCILCVCLPPSIICVCSSSYIFTFKYYVYIFIFNLSFETENSLKLYIPTLRKY